jgi:hypothetical protein
VAQAQSSEALKSERCANRLSIAFTGKSAAAAMLSSADPQSQADALVGGVDFQERFSRFMNALNNDDPGTVTIEDATYHLAKYVLVNNKPWKDLYNGKYTATVANNVVTIADDATGLGHFRWTNWLRRYAGNEQAGLKISTAYRLMHNVIGLRLIASTSAPGADVSATGRQAAGCRPCHIDGWFGLDKVSSVLTKRVGTGNNMTFQAPTAGPQNLLGGLTVANDGELVDAMVNSEAFKFNVCRTAFQFLYGRAEATCEGPVFDSCMQAFNGAGTMQSALLAVAKHPSFCQ